MIAGNANGSDGTGASGGTIQIDYGYGSGSTELDTSGFTNPAGKKPAIWCSTPFMLMKNTGAMCGERSALC